MISKNHEVSGLSFCEIKLGSGKRTATHGAFVGKSRLVSDQIDSGNLARRASWPIVRCDGPRADLSFFREARLGTYRAEVGLGELEPIDNRHPQACWYSGIPQKKQVLNQKGYEWLANLDPCFFFLFCIWNSCEPIGWGWWRSDIATPGHGWQWLIDTILHQLGWLRLKHCNASHDVKWCKILPIFA